MTCPRSHSQKAVEPGLEARQSGSDRDRWCQSWGKGPPRNPRLLTSRFVSSHTARKLLLLHQLPSHMHHAHPPASPRQLPAAVLHPQAPTWKSPPCSELSCEKNSEGSGMWHFRTFFSLDRGRQGGKEVSREGAQGSCRQPPSSDGRARSHPTDVHLFGQH